MSCNIWTVFSVGIAFGEVSLGCQRDLRLSREAERLIRELSDRFKIPKSSLSQRDRGISAALLSLEATEPLSLPEPLSTGRRDVVGSPIS